MTPLSESDLQRIAFLSRETEREWWERFARERNMLELSEAEIIELIELIELSREDEKACHQ